MQLLVAFHILMHKHITIVSRRSIGINRSQIHSSLQVAHGMFPTASAVVTAGHTLLHIDVLTQFRSIFVCTDIDSPAYYTVLSGQILFITQIRCYMYGIGLILTLVQQRKTGSNVVVTLQYIIIIRIHEIRSVLQIRIFCVQHFIAIVSSSSTKSGCTAIPCHRVIHFGRTVDTRYIIVSKRSIHHLDLTARNNI